jgi:hypothetical protein
LLNEIFQAALDLRSDRCAGRLANRTSSKTQKHSTPSPWTRPTRKAALPIGRRASVRPIRHAPFVARRALDDRGPCGGRSK